jgi:hypothetical protein
MYRLAMLQGGNATARGGMHLVEAWRQAGAGQGELVRGSSSVGDACLPTAHELVCLPVGCWLHWMLYCSAGPRIHPSLVSPCLLHAVQGGECLQHCLLTRWPEAGGRGRPQRAVGGLMCRQWVKSESAAFG